MPLPSFTISQAPKFSEILGDVAGGQLSPRAMVNARIIFRCNVTPSDFVLYEGNFERVRTIEAYVNTAGAIERKYDDGTLGPVKLLANDPGLNVSGIQWTIEVRVNKDVIRKWTFNAPAAGMSYNLATAPPVPSAPVVGILRGPVGPAGVDDVVAASGGSAIQFRRAGENVGPPIAINEAVVQAGQDAAAAAAPSAVAAQAASQVPTAVAAQAATTVPAAVDANLAGRNVVVTNPSAGLWQIEVGGVAAGAPFNVIAIENIVGNYEAETLALFDRMAVRPDTLHRTAINNLIKALKTNGVWAKLDSLYLLAAHTSQAALLNWKGNARNLIAYNSPVFTPDQGFAGDGATSYLATGAFSGVGLLMAQGNESIGCMIRNSAVPASNGARDLSVGTSSTGGSSNRNLLHRTTANTTSLRMNNTTTLNSGTHTPFGNNLMSLSHDGTNVKSYWNGANDYSLAVAPNDNTQTLTTLYTVLGRSGTAYATSQYSMAFTGALLTAGNHANLYNAVYDYLNALGAI